MVVLTYDLVVRKVTVINLNEQKTFPQKLKDKFLI